MTAYLALSACFLTGAAIGGGVLALVARRRPRLAALAVTAAVLAALTAVFDSLMIAAGLFRYSPAHLVGARVGLAPIEDFAYPLAGVLVLPALWLLLRGRGRAGDAPRTGQEEERV